MDKQEYFNSLLKRDFIRFILLKRPKYNDAEISIKLNQDIEANTLYHSFKSCIKPLLDKYFNSPELKDDSGKTVERLPNWLDNNLPGKIVAEYQALIDQKFPAINFIPQIIEHIERLTWLQGVDDMAHNLKNFIDSLNRTSEHFRKISPTRSVNYDLTEKYEAAKRITVREQLMQDNCKDVEEYIDTLRLYSRDLCEEIISNKLARLYCELAKSTQINALIDKFESIHSESLGELESFSGIAEDEELVKEYNQHYPMDFFRRNVADVSEEDAFRMLFLLGLARHEESLKADGFVTAEGEICLFTNPGFDGLQWLNRDSSKL